MPGTIGSVAEGISSSGGRALAVPCDVTKEDSVEAAVAATVAEFGGIDILVANAGVLWLGPIESTPLKRWQLCLDVNLTGVFLVTKAVIPHVRARGGGSLIAITTTGVTMAGSNAYWVSKAGVERLYSGLAADLKPDNIAVNCLSPSRVVLTEGWQAGGAGMEIPRRWSNRRRPWPTPPSFSHNRMRAESRARSSARRNSPSNRERAGLHVDTPRNSRGSRSVVAAREACLSVDTPLTRAHSRALAATRACAKYLTNTVCRGADPHAREPGLPHARAETPRWPRKARRRVRSTAVHPAPVARRPPASPGTTGGRVRW